MRKFQRKLMVRIDRNNRSCNSFGIAADLFPSNLYFFFLETNTDYDLFQTKINCNILNVVKSAEIKDKNLYLNLLLLLNLHDLYLHNWNPFMDSKF